MALNTINRSPSPFCNKGWLLLLTLKAIQFPNHQVIMLTPHMNLKIKAKNTGMLIFFFVVF
uniref:Uncharacterized protein n=1 Tax=Arsenophonus nasoniae TaxID=638 RepID=D2U162_9GAMM|nr:hypothetical protein ARN_22690 [Arsenophonus nasoniae]